jgi:hypothetical protein
MTLPTAKLAPHPKPLKSPDQLLMELNARLKAEFCLDPLPLYAVVTEGWTDLNYMMRAAQLALQATGQDLLAVRSPLAGESMQIGIVTPGKPGNPGRGGVPQMARLAEAIREACFLYDAYFGIAFVFDHDDAGNKAGADVIAEFGFKRDKYSLTLDPRKHPGACARKQVVIEDLLSLQIQMEFFEQGTAWCSAEYEDGQLRRFVWGHQSKEPLQQYVLERGKWSDLREVARVLARVREMWGLPVDLSGFDGQQEEKTG